MVGGKPTGPVLPDDIILVGIWEVGVGLYVEGDGTFAIYYPGADGYTTHVAVPYGDAHISPLTTTTVIFKINDNLVQLYQDGSLAFSTTTNYVIMHKGYPADTTLWNTWSEEWTDMWTFSDVKVFLKEQPGYGYAQFPFKTASYDVDFTGDPEWSQLSIPTEASVTSMEIYFRIGVNVEDSPVLTVGGVEVLALSVGDYEGLEFNHIPRTGDEASWNHVVVARSADGE